MTEVRSSGPRCRTLLLETDPGIAEALSEVLRTLGHEVATAASVAEALSTLHDGDVTLLVADDALPETLSELRRGLSPDRRLGVLLLTSDPGHDLAAELSEAPLLSVATLSKPFSVAHFARLAITLCARGAVLPRPRPVSDAPRRAGC